MHGRASSDRVDVPVAPLALFGGQNAYSNAQKAQYRGLRPDMLPSNKISERNYFNMPVILTRNLLPPQLPTGASRLQSLPAILPSSLTRGSNQ